MRSTGDSGPTSLSRLFHRLTSILESKPSSTEADSDTSEIQESPTPSIHALIQTGYTKWELRVQEMNRAYRASEQRKSLALPLHSQLLSEAHTRREHIRRCIGHDGSASEQELDSPWERYESAAKLCQEYDRHGLFKSRSDGKDMSEVEKRWLIEARKTLDMPSGSTAHTPRRDGTSTCKSLARGSRRVRKSTYDSNYIEG